MIDFFTSRDLKRLHSNKNATVMNELLPVLLLNEAYVVSLPSSAFGRGWDVVNGCG